MVLQVRLRAMQIYNQVVKNDEDQQEVLMRAITLGVADVKVA